MLHEQPVTEMQENCFTLWTPTVLLYNMFYSCTFAHHYGIKEILTKVEQGLIPLQATLDPKLPTFLKPLQHVHKTRSNHQMTKYISLYSTQDTVGLYVLDIYTYLFYQALTYYS